MNNIKSILFTAFILLTGLFTACDKDDDKSAGNTTLEVFGPSPALRGGELTFIGRGLDQVVKVILPEQIVITDIRQVNKERIQIVIPQDAEPGFVSLELANGKTLVTKTKLTYTEPIVFNRFSPAILKPGNEITIEGDYLNLIQKVIFADDVVVEFKAFKTWERSKIVLDVPMTAKTGNITLADTAAIPIEIVSKEILEVVLPNVHEIQNLLDKKPGDVITIKGNDLELVEKIRLGEKNEVEFARQDDDLIFVLPENAADEPVVLITYSGEEVIAANLVMAMPEQLAIVKGTGIKGGDLITINGVNMELITDIRFENVENAIVPDSKTTARITVAMPENAHSGELTLNTGSGKTVAIMIETLKPIVESYDPTNVPAGQAVTLKGSDLDLVTAITFGGDKTVDVIATSAVELTVTVPVDAESGEIILTLKNGETVICSSLAVEKPECCYIPVLPEESVNGSSVLIVEVKNGEKLTDVQLNGLSVQYILLGDQLYISIPANANGNTELKLISSNGEIAYMIDIIGSNIIETTVFEGLHNLGNWVNFTLDASALQGLKSGMYMRVFYITNDTNETWWQMKLMSQQAGWPALDNYSAPNDIMDMGYVAGTVQVLDVSLTDNDVNNLVATGLAIGGHEVTITKITIVEERSQAVVIYEGPKDVGNWAGYAEIGADKFAGAKAGQRVVVKTSDVQADAQGSFKSPNGWGEIASGTEYFDITGDFELPVTAETLLKLQESGLIIGGKNYIIQSVSLK
ncbi:MAG: IPT/TIG domain-containing protein [Bacteroidales bacterium]